jgi:hypothetical protein
VAGTYSVAVRNPSFNLSYVASYTQNVASALEYKTITIPGATTGTWSSDNTLWGSVDFCVATGANYVAPSANSWNSGNFLGVPGQTNLLAASGNGFRLTGVIFLAGNEAPSAAMSPFCMPKKVSSQGQIPALHQPEIYDCSTKMVCLPPAMIAIEQSN